MKTALLFDWFCYASNRNSIMLVGTAYVSCFHECIEPAILLMERSLERYSDVTKWCLEHLYDLVNSFHPPLKSQFHRHVSTAIQDILAKGVIP